MPLPPFCRDMKKPPAAGAFRGMPAAGVTMRAMAAREQRAAFRASPGREAARIMRAGPVPEMDRESADKGRPEPLVTAGKLGQCRDAPRGDRPGFVGAQTES